MKLFDLREVISRAVFWVQNIRYLSKRHYMLSVFLLIFIMLIIFSSIFINQKKALERKENIVRSFYEDAGTGDLQDTEVSSATEERVLISIHICGEIAEPGVYEVEEGSRVIDLIKIAGGESETACIDSLNLAQEVFDGQKIYVPSKEEAATGGFTGPDPFYTDNTGNSGYDTIVNINTAISSQLESLPGIGPVTAGKIISYREKYGAFKSIESLMDVSGIGPKKFEQIKGLIDV